LPLPQLELRECMKARYRRYDEIRSSILGGLEKYGDTFSLFATTFPGEDANEVARDWCRRTVDYLRE
jgi:hypothetical protein